MGVVMRGEKILAISRQTVVLITSDGAGIGNLYPPSGHPPAIVAQSLQFRHYFGVMLGIE